MRSVRCEVCFLGLGIVRFTLISHFPHPTSHNTNIKKILQNVDKPHFYMILLYSTYFVIEYVALI